MRKTILITGATDGIGLETAKMLYSEGHHILLHGRSAEKLIKTEESLANLSGKGAFESHLADLSLGSNVEKLAKAVAGKHQKLDVLINNAGIFKSPETVTAEGLDIRFAVNAIAPHSLALRLLPLLGKQGRIVNLSSAAQSPVNPKALAGEIRLSDYEAYAQSKLALTMASRHMAHQLEDKGIAVIAVNPGSLLGTNMVKDAFGVDGGDISIGAKILVRAALSEEFAEASGSYFDNDSGRFAPPHPDALDDQKCAEIVRAINAILKE